MYILKYEVKSKYFGFKKIFYKEFDNMKELFDFVNINNIVVDSIYRRGIK